MTTLENIVLPAVRDFRESLPEPEKFSLTAETHLLGNDAPLDSLSLVSFLVVVEEMIESFSGRSLRLVNEKAMSRSNSPFRSLSTLSDYIDELLAEIPS